MCRRRLALLLLLLLTSAANADCKQSRVDYTYDHGNYIVTTDKRPPNYGEYGAQGADALLAAKWAKGDSVLICDERDHQTIQNLSRDGRKIKVFGLIK